MKVTKAYVIELTLEELLEALSEISGKSPGGPFTDVKYQLVQMDQQTNGNLMFEVEEVTP